MRKVLIAEKPSLAKLIATALGRPLAVHDGYFEYADMDVTWQFGHLLEQAPPDAYDPALKKWTLESLPFTVPADRWLLLPKRAEKGRDDPKVQIEVISKLLRKATSVVHAGDPDREGQLLVDETLEYLGWTGATQRLRILDPNTASIRKALANMEPNSKYRNEHLAALSRSRADYLLGLNATRVASVRLGVTASIGRVQTPALYIAYLREMQITKHATTHFYTLHATVAGAHDSLVLVHDDKNMRILDKGEAQSIANALTGTQQTVSIAERALTEGSPMPYTMGSWLTAAEDAFGWSMKHAGDILQQLYERQLVSYPRTDCPYMPDEQAPLAVPMIARFIEGGLLEYAKPLQQHLAPNPKVYSSAKISESGESHYGITPTGKLPHPSLNDDQRMGWELITRNFVKSLLPDYKATEKTAAFTFNGRRFAAKGETPVNLAASWRALEPKRDVQPLPTKLRSGESFSGRVQGVELKQGKTTPPKRFTAPSLAEELKAVAKYVTDERLKAILKENAGIGTAATRKGIIETLIARKYIRLEGKKTKYVHVTPFGVYLCELLPKALTDPGVTAMWEEQLNLIAKGQASSSDFMEKIERFIRKHVDSLKQMEMPALPAGALEEPKPAKKAVASRRMTGKKRKYS